MTHTTTYPAALTRFDLPKDPHTRQHTPSLPTRLGIVHALNPTPDETKIREPWYIEDPHDYRAALCGSRVKVILPIPLSTNDPDGCWDCQRILRIGPPPPGEPEHWSSPTRQELNRRKQHFRRLQEARMLKLLRDIA